MTLKSSFPSESRCFAALQIHASAFYVSVFSVAYRIAAESLASGEKGRGMMLTVMLGGSATHICDYPCFLHASCPLVCSAVLSSCDPPCNMLAVATRATSNSSFCLELQFCL